MTATITNRTFGIELEVILPAGLTIDGLARAITAAGVYCASPRYGHAVSRSWRVVPDGSVYGGAEVVSPILRGEAGLAKARQVADAVRAAGCTVNVNCGFHVHVGAEDFSARQLAKAALTYMWFETFFDQIMPPSRRGNSNRYIASNRGQFGGYGTDALNAAFARVERATFAETDHRAAIREALNGRFTRYTKLNLTAFVPHDNRPGYKTIEFRQHSGTVEADKIEHWVRLCVAFVDKARVARPRARTVTRDLTSAEEMGQFFAMFPVKAETRAFYAERRRTLATVDRKAAREAQRAAA